MTPSWLSAPYAHRDPAYIAAARRVRETRLAWFQAVDDPNTSDFASWHRNVTRASAAYAAAVQDCKEHDDRVLAEQAAARDLDYSRGIGDRVKRFGGKRGVQ